MVIDLRSFFHIFKAFKEVFIHTVLIYECFAVFGFERRQEAATDQRGVLVFDFGYSVGFKGLLPAVNNLRRPIRPAHCIQFTGWKQGFDFRRAASTNFLIELFDIFVLSPWVHQLLIAQTAFFQVGGYIHQRSVTTFKIGTDVGLRADRFAVGVNAEAVNQALGVGKVGNCGRRNDGQRKKNSFSNVL